MKFKKHFFELFLVLGVCVCFSLSLSATAEPQIDIKKKFNHKKHKSTFQDKSVFCADCHLTNLLVNIKDGEDYKAISGEVKLYRYESCHFCHKNPEKGNIAPNRCTLCHQNKDEILPKNHIRSWKSSHANNAKFEPASCKKCHMSSFCIDCHKSKRELERKVHPGNFIYTHSIMVRAMPNKCTSCHQVKFCVSCHSKRK